MCLHPHWSQPVLEVVVGWKVLKRTRLEKKKERGEGGKGEEKNGIG